MLGKSLVVGALALQTATALQSACAKNEEVAVDDNDTPNNANDVFEGDESQIFWEFHVNEDVDMSTGAELFMLYPTDINTDAGDWASGIKTNYVQMQLLRNKIIEVHPELATVETKADGDGTTAPFPAEDGYLAGFTLGWLAHDPKTRQRELNNWLKRVQSARLLDYAHKEWVELRVGGIFEGDGVDSKESAIGDGWEEVNVNVDIDQKQQEAKNDASSQSSPAKSSASASNTGTTANANDNQKKVIKNGIAIKSKPLPALPTASTPPTKAKSNQPPATPPKPKELTSQVEHNILKQI